MLLRRVGSIATTRRLARLRAPPPGYPHTAPRPTSYCPQYVFSPLVRAISTSAPRMRGPGRGPFEDDLYDEGHSDDDGQGAGGGKKGGSRLKIKTPPSDAHAREQHEHKEAERLYDAKNSADQAVAVNATKVGAGVNLVLAAGKGSIGFLVGSTGLMADGANHLGDLLCDAVVWYTVIESRKGATVDRPWGMGKLEPLGALTVGGLLMATGMGIGYSAAMAAWDMWALQVRLRLQAHV